MASSTSSNINIDGSDSSLCPVSEKSHTGTASSSNQSMEAYAPRGAAAAAAIAHTSHDVSVACTHDGMPPHASNPKRQFMLAAAKLAAEFMGPLGTIPSGYWNRPSSALTTRQKTVESLTIASSMNAPKRNSGTHFGCRRGRSPASASGTLEPMGTTGMSPSAVRRKVMAFLCTFKQQNKLTFKTFQEFHSFLLISLLAKIIFRLSQKIHLFLTIFPLN